MGTTEGSPVVVQGLFVLQAKECADPQATRFIFFFLEIETENSL